MASAITLQSDTLESQFLEILTAILNKELSPATNPLGTRYFDAKWTTSSNNFQLQGTFTLKGTLIFDNNNKWVLELSSYLIDQPEEV